jgi:hypothetical protein
MKWKWIFKIKLNVCGFVPSYKTHILATRFSQVEGIELNEMFSIIAWMEPFFFQELIFELYIHRWKYFLNVC